MAIQRLYLSISPTMKQMRQSKPDFDKKTNICFRQSASAPWSWPPTGWWRRRRTSPWHCTESSGWRKRRYKYYIIYLQWYTFNWSIGHVREVLWEVTRSQCTFRDCLEVRHPSMITAGSRSGTKGFAKELSEIPWQEWRSGRVLPSPWKSSLR